MNPTLVRAACRTAYHSGLLRAAMRVSEPFAGERADHAFQVLVYHRVADDGDPFVPATPVAAFERHVRYLRRHFRVLPLTELAVAARRRELPTRAIAITFDDGYEDTYAHAYPIIRRYQVPVTVYLATELLDGDRPMWNDLVGAAIRDTTRAVLDAIPDCGPLPLTTPAERESATRRALEALKRLPPRERDGLVAQVLRSLNVAHPARPRMLQWRQIEEMRAGGVEFGAHTVHHPILTAISPDEAWREIADSKRAIEQRLQAPADHFAYPNGTARDFDESIKELVRRAGFTSAVTTVFGTNDAATDPYEWRREGAWEDTTPLFATKLWWYRRRGAASASATA